jgi:hypothetical protein
LQNLTENKRAPIDWIMARHYSRGLRSIIAFTSRLHVAFGGEVMERITAMTDRVSSIYWPGL